MKITEPHRLRLYHAMDAVTAAKYEVNAVLDTKVLTPDSLGKLDELQAALDEARAALATIQAQARDGQ